MKQLLLLLLLAGTAVGQSVPAAIPPEDAIRVREFYRLAAKIQDGIWPKWSEVPAPLLLVTADGDFLTHHPAPPKDWKEVGEDIYAHANSYPVNFQATFPAFGPPAVIVIGQPKKTASKSSTPWLIVVMHEHFHQLQWAQPGINQAIEALSLAGDDKSGMWMLNYPFPYEKPEVARSFAELRDALLGALAERNDARFTKLAKAYVERRKKFFAQLSPKDGKYLSFQLWQEGIARYTQIKAAEAAAGYVPSEEFAKLSDFEPFLTYAAKARQETLDELRRADLAEWKRRVVYSFGAAEGLLLDRMRPSWKADYFKHPLTLDPYFAE